MKHIAPAVAPDKFSWMRVVAVMKLMWPRLKNTLLVYGVVGVAATLLMLVLKNTPFFASLLPFIVFIPSLLFYIAPAFVVAAMTANQFSLLPATVGEKLAALCIYGLVIFPLAVYLLPQISSSWFLFHGDNLCKYNPFVPEIINRVESWQFMLSFGSTFLPGSVCLFSAVKHPGTKWRPAVMAILVVFLLGLAGGIIGVVEAFRIGYNDAFSVRDADQGEEFMTRLINEIIPWMWALCGVCIVLTVMFVRLTYIKLAHRQL